MDCKRGFRLGDIMSAYTDTDPSTLSDLDELSVFCDDLFASLPRSDQRKWGEVYLRGLLFLQGRKSIRRISDEVVGRRVDQSLQQFVNQSPWQWHGVRSTLARRASAIRPQAWLVQEAIFPKNGRRSVGVAKQYAPSVGRTLNCQLGLAVSLANSAGRCAVNWRLALPRSWDDDLERRERARVPVDERHRPYWRHVFDAVDEMVVDWGLRPAPIVWNAVGQEVSPLLRGLTQRRLPYLVQVSEHAPVLQSRSESGVRCVATAGELAEISASRRHVMFRVPDRTRGASFGTRYSLMSICDLCALGKRVQITSTCQHGGTRRLLAQWSWHPGGGQLTGVWLTNLTSARLNQLVDLVELYPQAGREDMALLRDEFGLHDFEGRSYAGWHHHVTLVSAAQAYDMLRRGTPAPAEPDGGPARTTRRSTVEGRVGSLLTI
jgi:hypothetical protein